MSRLIKRFLRLLSHNLNHYIDVRFSDQHFFLCARCTGMLLGFIVSLPVVLVVDLYHASGNVVAAASLCLFLPDFVYWGLTRTKCVPDVNAIRVLNGFLVGVSIAAYGQANLHFGIKIAIILLLWVLILIGNPVLGRTRRA